jgi:hypothetical protein
MNKKSDPKSIETDTRSMEKISIEKHIYFIQFNLGTLWHDYPNSVSDYPKAVCVARMSSVEYLSMRREFHWFLISRKLPVWLGDSLMQR